MSQDKRKGWIRDLKPGDRVAVDVPPHSFWGVPSSKYLVCAILRITPTGRILTRTNRGNDVTFTEKDYSSLIQVTREVLQEQAHSILVYRVMRLLDRHVVPYSSIVALPKEKLRLILGLLEPMRVRRIS